MRASVFIPTSNRMAPLRKCLDSLTNQSNSEFAILLVGLEKNEKISKLIKKYKKLTIEHIIQKQPGIVDAANIALKYASYDFFIRIDDDVITDKNWFQNIIKTFDSDKKIVGVTGPTIMSEDDVHARDLTHYLHVWGNSTNPLHIIPHLLYVNILYENKMMEPSQILQSGAFTIGSNYTTSTKLKNSIEATNLEACNFAVRTSALKKLGGFNRLYRKGLGDYHEAEMAQQIKSKKLHLVFNPKVLTRHNVRSTTMSSKSRGASFWRIQNFILFWMRNQNPKTVSATFRFLTNVILQNAYYGYKCFSTKNVCELGAIPGTFVGFVRAPFHRV